MQRTLFVTGGAGYVGSHCCKAFAEVGWRVVVYDNLSTGWADFVKWGPLVRGDILDLPRLTDAMKAAKPDAVAHFAALASVAESMAHPERYYEINVAGTLNILKAMLTTGVGKLVFSSTCATYGAPLQVPIDESHRQKPINPYGWSKLFVERMLQDFDAAHGVRHVSLRYFNAAGADAAAIIGERHEPEFHVIPLAIRGAIDGDYAFTILGDDYDTRDGTAMRDFIHVTDLASAHCNALEYLVGGGDSLAVNLGTGSGTTVCEIADAVERVAGRALPRRVGPRRHGDPAALVANPARAKEILGWNPRHSEIEFIVESAWRWHAQRSCQ